MAKKLKSIMEDNEINDIEDLLKDQEPKVDQDGEDIFESEDEENKDDIEVDESDEEDDKDLEESEIEEIIDASDKELNALGKKATNQGKSGGDETITEDEFETGEDDGEDIFESEDEEEELDEPDEEDEKVDEEEEEEEEKLEEARLSPKELKIVMEALEIPASSKKEIQVVFEAMVSNKIKSQKALIEKKAAAKVSKIRKELIEGIELYADDVVRKWKEANQPIFESKAKLSRLEEGFHKISQIFQELGLESSLNESKTAQKYSELSKKYTSLLERNKKLEAYVEKVHVRELYESYVSDLSKNQKRRFIALAETLEYSTLKDLKEKLEAVKKLFVEKKVYEEDELENTTVDEENFEDDGVITPPESTDGVTDPLITESVKLFMR